MAIDIGRREFISALGGAAAAWPVVARAQQSPMPVVGTLFAQSATQWADFMAGFRSGLSEVGFIDGHNVRIEYRWANGQFDLLPTLAADLVSRKIAVMFVGGSVVAVRAAITATQTIPIVFTSGVDPVAAGLVQSLNRPIGNVTGVTMINSELGPKKLELLHEAIPTATKIALLVNPNNPVTLEDDVQGGQAAARRLGLEIIVLNGGTETEIESAFATAVQQHAAALLVGSDAFHVNRRAQISALALRHGLPTMSSTREAVVAGELMSYGANQIDMYRRAGTYVGRIVKGDKPADLPVLLPSRFELVINLQTAKALGLTIPSGLLALSDEVIE